MLLLRLRLERLRAREVWLPTTEVGVADSGTGMALGVGGSSSSAGGSGGSSSMASIFLWTAAAISNEDEDEGVVVVVVVVVAAESPVTSSLLRLEDTARLESEKSLRGRELQLV